MKKNIYIILCFILITTMLTSCVSTPKSDELFHVDAEDSQTDQFEGVKGTAIDEVEYGNKIYLKIRAAGIVCEDAKVKKYLFALRDKMMPYVSRETLPYIITPINDRRIYAASTPGGFIYVSLGMLAYVDSESELAAVLAHEMAQTQYKPQKFRLSKLIFGFFRSCVKIASYIFFPGFGINYGLKAVDKFVLKDISVENAVLRADAMAVQYLDKAGYRVSGYADMLMSFKNYNACLYEKLSIYLANRPITDKRIEAVKELLEPYSKDEERKIREIQSYNKVNAYVDSLMAQMP